MQGAGDAFVGALATYLVTHKDQPMHQIIGAACYVATQSVTKEGTQTSYPDKINAFNRSYKYLCLWIINKKMYFKIYFKYVLFMSHVLQF